MGFFLRKTIKYVKMTNQNFLIAYLSCYMSSGYCQNGAASCLEQHEIFYSLELTDPWNMSQTPRDSQGLIVTLEKFTLKVQD